MSPSLHFRHSTRCNVVWVDSHVSSEKMEFSKGYSFLSLSPVECRKLYKLGWMGQDNNNLFDLK
ncbi:MAG: hypothetical protein GY750_17345 [Lentisphaerae bacterium]|nr:hypothetical protein [Lentisphaerota bacterium]MCP4103164.1 hypothetical protein [Lentisphaerota bacterium]